MLRDSDQLLLACTYSYTYNIPVPAIDNSVGSVDTIFVIFVCF